MASVQRKLKLANIAPDKWYGGSKISNEMVIQSNAETPRTQFESNVNGRPETMLNKSNDFMKKPY